LPESGGGLSHWPRRCWRYRNAAEVP